jgi:TM2 domain-containing membrane protein YozV
MNCGVAIKNAASSDNLNGQDKIVMILICLFLGGLGIHNFMMGETKKGVFRIIMSLCCGLGAIFALIDLVKIAMGTYVVDPEKLI